MNFDFDSVTGIINRIIANHIKYMVPREGQVKNINDPADKGRVLVVIPTLGWDTDDKGAWCYPIDKNSLTTVSVNEWVIVQFVNGNPDFPVYIGKSNRISDQIPDSYKDSDTQVIFEPDNGDIRILYDLISNTMNIGNTDFRGAARKDDAVKVRIPINTVLVGAQGAVFNATPIDLDGTITEGSEQILIGDK